MRRTDEPPSPPFHGLVATAHSPLHDDGSLAPEVVGIQARFLSSRGIQSVFITGLTGESHSLTHQERIERYEA